MLEVVAKVIPENETSWDGTATDLLEKLKETDPNIRLAVNALGRKLNVSAERLYNEYGLRFESVKSHEGRSIILTRVKEKDTQEQNKQNE